MTEKRKQMVKEGMIVSGRREEKKRWEREGGEVMLGFYVPRDKIVKVDGGRR